MREEEICYSSLIHLCQWESEDKDIKKLAELLDKEQHVDKKQL